jgi:septin family protein
MNQEGGETHLDAPAGADLQQIREILFGSQFRDVLRQLRGLFDIRTRDVNELRCEMSRRVEALEAYIQKEAGALRQRIEAERGQHEDAARALERRMDQFEQTTAQGQRELRQQILAQSKEFLDELHRLREEITQALGPNVEAAHAEAA